MQPGSRLSLQHYLSAAESAIAAGDVARAVRISAEAALKDIEHPGILALAVYHCLDLGDVNRALRYAMRARELAPRQTDVLNAFGQALVKSGRQREAIGIFDEALAQSPRSFVTHFNKAKALIEISELKRAREHFLHALELDPRHAHALTNVAHLAAQRGDATEAREFAHRALRADPNQIDAGFALATAELIDGKNETVLAILKPLLDRPGSTAIERATAHSLAGDALDGLGRTEEAFRAYCIAGDEFRAGYAAQYARAGRVTASALARRLKQYFSNTPPWPKSASGAFRSPVETHVFLLGFPRSGTTLLGQVLAAHPEIETMEEHSCFDDAHTFILEEGGLDRLAALDSTDLDKYRAAYWKRAEDAGCELSRPVLIDKLPLNSVLLCLIAKLFPDAKILFAVRDPRDVVFSCFRRRFGMTLQMYELLTLDGAASYYDDVMSLTHTYRATLPLELLEARHEDLVDDLQSEAERLCGFLGVEYSPSMASFAPAARERHIDTPSAAQVARGLFRDGRQKWRDYREYMPDVLSRLDRWVEHFGYPPD